MLCYEIENYLNSMDILYKKDVDMRFYTSFRIGGICKIVCFPININQVYSVISYCKKKCISYFILGNGSNLLFCDGYYYGVAICAKKLNKIQILGNNRVYCESGVSLYRLCNFLAENCLSNFEFAYGIPGSVGGAIYMNAGAYGFEMKDVVENVYYIDCKRGSCCSFNKNELQFSYRHSIFEENNNFIFGAVLSLQQGNKVDIKRKMQDIFAKRKKKQPLNFPSAGSIFKRPKEGFAAKLIEDCGLKGFIYGGAKVSTKHSGFIINTGGASSEDVKNLMKIIQKVVLKKKGVRLVPEIKFVG